jgi:hypothetical protein
MTSRKSLRDLKHEARVLLRDTKGNIDAMIARREELARKPLKTMTQDELVQFHMLSARLRRKAQP